MSLIPPPLVAHSKQTQQAFALAYWGPAGVGPPAQNENVHSLIPRKDVLHPVTFSSSAAPLPEPCFHPLLPHSPAFRVSGAFREERVADHHREGRRKEAGGELQSIQSPRFFCVEGKKKKTGAEPKKKFVPTASKFGSGESRSLKFSGNWKRRD